MINSISFFQIQDRVHIIEQSEEKIEYSLPFAWRKIGYRRAGQLDRWDFYIITPDEKKLRSNPEIERYLEKNPDVDCDREVTNTSRPWAEQTPAKSATKSAAKPAAKRSAPKPARNNTNYLGKEIFKLYCCFLRTCMSDSTLLEII